MMERKNTEMLCIGVCLNSNAHPKIESTGKFEQIGNKTECALLEMAYKMGYDFREIRKNTKVYSFFKFRSLKRFLLVQKERKCHVLLNFKTEKLICL